jgi:chorismate mutase
MMAIRGVRGAIQVEEDTPEAIAQATRQLLGAIQDSNPGLQPTDLASAFFTLTIDLSATYPALAAREFPGWEYVPLLCGQEIPVPTGMPRCLRVLIHWNTTLDQKEICHVYLGETAKLRPDLALARS